MQSVWFCKVANLNLAKCLLKVQHNLASFKRVATLTRCRGVFAPSQPGREFFHHTLRNNTLTHEG